MSIIHNEFEFVDMTLVEIGQRFSNDLKSMIQFCRDNGMLISHMECPKCETECQEGIYSRAVDGIGWRCLKCKKIFNLRRGSFFENSHLHLWQIFAITYLWSQNCLMGKSRGLSIEQICRELHVGSVATIVEWHRACRDVCIDYFVEHPDPIGGPNITVEVSVCLFSRRRSSMGRLVPERKIFVGYEPAGNCGFLIPIPDTDAETLIPIIQNWILPESIVYTEDLPAYDRLSELCYTHRTLPIMRTIDPQTKAVTNQLEVMWQRAKSKLLSNGLRKDENLGEYIAEYMWNERFGKTSFYEFWKTITTEMFVVD